MRQTASVIDVVLKGDLFYSIPLLLTQSTPALAARYYVFVYCKHTPIECRQRTIEENVGCDSLAHLGILQYSALIPA